MGSKKKLLFVIPGLGAGGAEKSLVNLLHQIDYDRFDVDLFLFKSEGLFLNSLPLEVNLLKPSTTFEKFGLGLFQSCNYFLSKLQLNLLVSRIVFFVTNRFVKNKAVAEQKSWKYFSKAIAPLEKKYNAAIGFLEKSSIYFVVDKVDAQKKIGFIHNDYNQLGLDKSFDDFFLKRLDSIVTVSEKCADVLKETFVENQSKVSVMFNISSKNLIKQLANDFNLKEIVPNFLSILSIGRLDHQKGFDMAVEACLLLIKKNLNIKWYIIGGGTERLALEQKIKEHGLENRIILLGLKENPYPYLKACDIYVQPSRYEGKSIAVDEAKILAKPIVVTNFTTAKDQIESGVNGLICEMTPEAIADAIMALIENKEMSHRFSTNLTEEKLGTEDEINKLYQLINS